MSDFGRRKGESASGWAARLARVDPSGVTLHQLDDLTACHILAAMAAKREEQVRRRRGPGLASTPRASDSAALRRCKEAVHALSPEDRRRFVQWVVNGMPD